ncbi:hypothetical protein ACKFKG_29790 [Phormidesmis sp. 146-35]
MSLPKVIDDVVSYISGAMSRIFGPTDDSYPETGVQPYQGDYKHPKKHRSD